MKIQQALEHIRQQRLLHGRDLPVAVQVNEDEVYLVAKLSIIFREEDGKKTAHSLMFTPELFREPTGAPPCAHLDESGTAHVSIFCPDCGAKLKAYNHETRGMQQ